MVSEVGSTAKKCVSALPPKRRVCDAGRRRRVAGCGVLLLCDVVAKGHDSWAATAGRNFKRGRCERLLFWRKTSPIPRVSPSNQQSHSSHTFTALSNPSRPTKHAPIFLDHHSQNATFNRIAHGLPDGALQGPSHTSAPVIMLWTCLRPCTTRTPATDPDHTDCQGARAVQKQCRGVH